MLFADADIMVFGLICVLERLQILMVMNEAVTMVAPPNPLNIITALTSAFKSQNGKAASSMCIAQLLKQNMGQLGKLMQQGKLTAIQIQQVHLLLNQVRFVLSHLGILSVAERLVLPESSSELWFEPEHFQTGPCVWSGVQHNVRIEPIIRFGVQLMPENTEPIRTHSN